MGKLKKGLKESTKNKSYSIIDYWNSTNHILILVGIGLLILGYSLMTFSPWDNYVSLSISPIILLIGYLLIIPLSIMFKRFKKQSNVSSKN